MIYIQDEEETTEISDGYVTVALGNTWSHNVNTRLILQYLDGEKRQVRFKLQQSKICVILVDILNWNIVLYNWKIQNNKNTLHDVKYFFKCFSVHFSWKQLMQLNLAELSWTTFLHVDIRQQWNRCISTVVTWMNKIFQVLVAKSPVAPFTAFNYTIQKDGIVQEGKYKVSCLLLKIWQSLRNYFIINLGKFPKNQLEKSLLFSDFRRGSWSICWYRSWSPTDQREDFTAFLQHMIQIVRV